MAVPPNVAIICNSLPPYREHLHLRVAREMRDEIRLWTICTHEGTDARWKFDPPAEINPVSFGLDPNVPDRHVFDWASFKKGGQIIRWIRENDVRAVAMMGYNDAARARIIRWCKRNRIPCFVWGDSNVKLDRATGIRALSKKLAVGTILSWASGALCCGRYGREYFEKYGVPSECIFSFPNEPDYDLIEKVSPQQVEQIRARFGLDPHRRRLVYVGRFLEMKRPHVAVEAFVKAAGKIPDWDLLLVGDGEMRPKMEAMISPELKNRVLWTGHLSNQADVAAIYHACDVLILPSWYEAWALVVNEATAAGLAIVCSDVVGASAELVRDGENGRMFPPDDVDAVVNCILDVTRSDRIDAMKAASIDILKDWRRRGDPIEGLRSALRSAGVINPKS